MDKQEYKIFLSCVAKEIETLPAVQKKQFRQRLQNFYDKFKLWDKADKAACRKINQYREDAKAHLESLSIIKVLYKRSCDKPNVFRQIAQILNKYGFKTRDGKTKRWKASTVENIIKSKYKQYRKATEKGWIQEKIWIHTYIVRRDVKIPEHCPLDWLSLPKAYSTFWPEWFPEPEPCKNDEERLLARYVLLAIIHEKALTGPRAVRISNGIWPEDEQWVKDIWSGLAQPDEFHGLSVEEVRNEIDIALEYVKANLPNKPTETEPLEKGGQGEKPIGAGREHKPKKEIVAVTIPDFINQYCEGSFRKSERIRFKTSLQKANGRAKVDGKIIKLPKHTGRWKRGKPKRFDPEKLKANWAIYRKFNSSLPTLKPSL